MPVFGEDENNVPLIRYVNFNVNVDPSSLLNVYFILKTSNRRIKDIHRLYEYEDRCSAVGGRIRLLFASILL